jgi:acetyl esterase/lipase
VRDVEDTIVFRQGLEDMLAARQPGDFHGFIIGAASIGSVVGVQGMQIMAAYLATEVQAGNIEFVTAKEFVSRYEHWEATGDVPPASNTSNTSGLDLHEWEDLTYASVDAIDLKLDLYVPDSEGPHPLIIFIHGGAFFMGDKTDVSSKLGVTRLYDDGNGEWAIASINYRLTGVAIWPAQIQDCKAAVRWLRANAATYDIDPNMFVSVGTSAGGMLAAMLEVTEGSAYHEDLSMGNANVSSDVQGVIDWYGPVDAIMIQREAAAETDPYVPASPHVALLGCEYDNCSQALLDSATARTMVDGNESPILVMHGMADESVNVSNSMAFVNALAENGSNYTAHYLPNVGHGSDYAWNMPVGYAKAHIFLAGLLSEYRSS